MISAIQDKDTHKFKLACLYLSSHTQTLYLAYLMKFFRLKDRDLSPASLSSRSLAGAPQLITEDLISTFTECTTSPTGIVKYRVTTKLKDKILAYLCALTLHLDGFMVEFNSIATDLGIPMSRYVFFYLHASTMRIYKELGCRVDALKKSEAGSSGIKRAVLSLPLVFPQKSTPKKQK